MTGGSRLSALGTRRSMATVVLAAALSSGAAIASAQSRAAIEPHVERLDPALDAIVAADARIETLATGFRWAEGPVWRKGEGGYLLFSDVPGNTIHRWSEQGGLSTWMRPAGHAGDTPPGRELGTNGLTLDAEGRVVAADHGNRRIMRVDDARFTTTTLASRFEGRRLNSPNDLAYRPNGGGDLYFTDPPYGLAGGDRDSAKELAFNGVYRLTPDGQLSAVVRDHTRPNGIAFSPDGRTAYVAVSDPERAEIAAYDVAPDGSFARRRVLFDATPLVRQGKPGLPDGLKVDHAGTLFATGPGGVLVLSPTGRHLGTIVTGQPTANVAFGDDGTMLYVTANDRLMRVRLKTRGALP